ncbi:MAG: phenylacetic acid degradation operon negative regulatory protein PaaX [Chloroflexi bacterium]|nr:phenylacetic acid degradation operon negative regulatory protein PaaX [Chloroflexota bacterium]
MTQTQTITNGTRPVRTQFLIFTLFGDYIVPRGGKIWTGSLLHLMDVLGVSERAVRSALSRMRRKGWLETKRHGRRSQYALTPRGQTLLEGGGQRIFEPVMTEWDDKWHLVVYSLPGDKRGERHILRAQLSWLGFGSLAPGNWVSPRNRITELKRISNELDLEAYVQMFSGIYLGPSSVQSLVEQCWDLQGLANQYKTFIVRYQGEYAACQADQNNGRPLEPQTCFQRRYWFTQKFQSFPLKDPNLPTVLLPDDWIGFRGRQLFEAYRQLLSRMANQFVDEVMEK